MTVVRELVNLITFKPDEGSAKKTEARTKELADGMRTLALGVGAIFAGVNAAAALAAGRINEIAKEAEQAGLTTQGFQALTGAVEAIGGEAEDVRAGLAEMRLRAQEAFEDPGGSMAERFKRYGIDVRDANGNLRDTEQLLLDIADKSEALEKSGQSAKFLQDELIGDSDALNLAPLLNQGADGLRAAIGEASKGRFFITEEEQKAAEEFAQEFTAIKNIAQDLATKAFAKMLPPIKAGIETFRGFLDRNRELIDSGLETFAGAVEVAFVGVEIAVNAARNVWTRFSDAVGGGGNALAIAALAVGALAAVFFAVPLAIGAAIAAVVLFVDEITAWANGAPSLIGEFLGPFEEMPEDLRAIFERTGDVFAFVGTLVSAVVNGDIKQAVDGAKLLFTQFFGPLEDMPALVKDTLGLVADQFRSFADLFMAIIEGDLGGVADAIQSIVLAPFQLIGRALAGVIDSAIGLINGLIEDYGGLLGLETINFSAVQALQDSSVASFQRDAQASVAREGGGVVQTNQTTVTVHATGTDPAEAARMVEEKIQENDERNARRMGELAPRVEAGAF